MSVQPATSNRTAVPDVEECVWLSVVHLTVKAHVQPGSQRGPPVSTPPTISSRGWCTAQPVKAQFTSRPAHSSVSSTALWSLYSTVFSFSAAVLSQTDLFLLLDLTPLQSSRWTRPRLPSCSWLNNRPLTGHVSCLWPVGVRGERGHFMYDVMLSVTPPQVKMV